VIVFRGGVPEICFSSFAEGGERHQQQIARQVGANTTRKPPKNNKKKKKMTQKTTAGATRGFVWSGQRVEGTRANNCAENTGVVGLVLDN